MKKLTLFKRDQEGGILHPRSPGYEHADYCVRFMIKGKRHFRKLGTTDAREGQKRASIHYEEIRADAGHGFSRKTKPALIDVLSEAEAALLDLRMARERADKAYERLDEASRIARDILASQPNGAGRLS